MEGTRANVQACLDGLVYTPAGPADGFLHDLAWPRIVNIDLLTQQAAGSSVELATKILVHLNPSVEPPRIHVDEVPVEYVFTDISTPLPPMSVRFDADGDGADDQIPMVVTVSARVSEVRCSSSYTSATRPPPAPSKCSTA